MLRENHTQEEPLLNRFYHKLVLAACCLLLMALTSCQINGENDFARIRTSPATTLIEGSLPFAALSHLVRWQRQTFPRQLHLNE